MNLAILSRGSGWHVQDLLRASREAGHHCESLDFRTQYSGSLVGCDAVLVRTMPAGSLEQIVFRMDLLHAAESKGTRVVNPPRALETCVDKYLTDVRLEAAGLPLPRTVVCQTCDDAMTAFDSLGSNVVVKPLFGSEGRGMLRITDREIAWRTFQTLVSVQCVIYVQEFIRHPGWDIRAFVIGRRVVAAMKRSNPDDWRTNVAQGGSTEACKLDEDVRDLAISAAFATGALIAGVDLLQDETGHWKVVEVNAAPGWRAISSACDIDIANAIVKFLEAER